MNCTDSTESDAALSELIGEKPCTQCVPNRPVYAFRNQSDEAFE